MSWRVLRRGGLGLCAAAGYFCVFALGFARTSSAVDLDAHLAAGEFAKAKEAAAGIPEARLRDAALGKIVAAQMAGGAGIGSLETAHDMTSDLARRAALVGPAGGGFFGPRGGGGGLTQADFDPLIELITTTVAPQSWDEVGGPGSIEGFPGGVWVDPAGLLKKFTPDTDRSLAMVRAAAASPLSAGGDPRRTAILRKVSLTRLEREVQLLRAMGREPDEAMHTLAGLRRIKYIMIYPETGDIVVAGPAGDWRTDLEGRFVSADKNVPVVRLDDLVVVMRNALGDSPKFGCSITPTREGLAAAQAVGAKWAAAPLKPGQRDQWLGELRDAVGLQNIEVYGIDPQSRAARVIVEADYRMKLVGMGLEEGTLGVKSYLDSVEVGPDGSVPPLSVLRWWFTLNYDALRATAERDAFELRGPGVRVQSENELLSDRGDRIHTGKSDVATAQFAETFTKHFETLAAKYPVYADMRNIFDLALVAAVVRSHEVAGQTSWHLTHFGHDGGYEIERGIAPAKVDSVINHRVIGGKHVIAGVSGGVTVDARELAARQAVQTDEYGLVAGERKASAPKSLPRHAWWWD
ncbi:MAG: DUF1598 domain-containing protein [Pirellulaceae bacterium]|nr:DUF1598 domain-containing protein [Pirellulaceae bacterium]